MGMCCAVDVIPDVPDNIRPDPPMMGEMLDVAVAKFGTFARDYGIWDKEYPDSSDARRQKIWLWFNKGNVNGNANQVSIDLENFVRGHLEKEPNKGRVLYTARLSETPFFQTRMKAVNDGSAFQLLGIFNGGYNEPDDFTYINHTKHLNQWRHAEGRELEPHVLMKWSFTSSVQLFDGDLGRARQYFGTDPVILEVFSKGAIACTYKEWEREEEIRDGEGNVTGTRMVRGVHKHQTPFVDRVEFRLSFRGQIWAQWFTEGDTFIFGNANATIESPLFTTTLQGGWFSSNFRTVTKPGVDPALAVLIAHVCATEFSVSQIENDLQGRVRTPDKPPPNWGDYFQSSNAQIQPYNNGIQFVGGNSFKMF